MKIRYGFFLERVIKLLHQGDMEIFKSEEQKRWEMFYHK